MAEKIKIYSIFNSIDGEVNRFHQGGFTTFIRFAGCNLKCSYCDTLYAQDPNCGKEMTVAQIIKEVKTFGCKKVTITGGEPLMQIDGFIELCQQLQAREYDISVETNGTIDGEEFIQCIDCWVVDYKLPSSGVKEKQINMNFLEDLNDQDFVKFVITCKGDYVIAKKAMKKIIKNNSNFDPPYFAFSPMHGSLEPQTLVEWIQKDKLFDNIIINLQLHKYIWKNAEKEV